MPLTLAPPRATSSYCYLLFDALELWQLASYPRSPCLQGWTPGFVNIEMIAFPHLFPHFFSEMDIWLGLCNHLAENMEAEGEMLSKCSFTISIVNKASFWPVLNCTFIMTHLGVLRFSDKLLLKIQTET